VSIRAVRASIAASHCFAYALGGLTLILGHGMVGGPYPSAGVASAALVVTWCLLWACVASYAAVHVGIAFLGRDLGVPALMWGAGSVAVVAPLVTLVPFPVVSLCLASLGIGLCVARVRLGTAAALAGGLEMTAGLIGSLSGPAVPSLLLIPALVCKVRAMRQIIRDQQAPAC
jgi:hypothetical protein